MKTLKFTISGKVQGVWFRQSTRTRAEHLGLVGCAINLDDGRVEVIASGNEDALHELANFIAVGPELANVTSVETCLISELPFNGFTTG